MTISSLGSEYQKVPRPPSQPYRGDAEDGVAAHRRALTERLSPNRIDMHLVTPTDQRDETGHLAFFLLGRILTALQWLGLSLIVVSVTVMQLSALLHSRKTPLAPDRVPAGEAR